MSAFVNEWYLAERDAGREITVEEFAQRRGISRATAYRRLEMFREVFRPGLSPSDVVAHVSRSIEAQRIPTRIVAQLVTS